MSKPLIVKLGPEAVLIGRVTEQETGKAIAGVRVRALPKGKSNGGGGIVGDPWPLTDANGHYRIAGLQPGPYTVQTHISDRRANLPKPVTMIAKQETRLDVEVEKRHVAKLQIDGVIPTGPPRLLEPALWSFMSGVANGGNFQHYMRPPASMPLTSIGLLTFGPLPTNKLQASVFVPSRTRADTGTRIALPKITFGDEPVALTLPDLTSTIVHGRIEASQALPFERVAVLAKPTMPGQPNQSWGSRPSVAGVHKDGTFAIDLPAGTYCMQLADVMNGIVFHTMEDDIIPSAETVVVKPPIHWLDVQFVAEQHDDPIVVSYLRMTLACPRNGKQAAFLVPGSRSNETETGGTTVYVGSTGQRWLVPPGDITVTASQSFDRIKPGKNGWQTIDAATESINIQKPTHHIDLVIPAPPTDAEVLKR